MVATAIRNIRFMNSKGRFTSLMRSKTAWWFTQIMPMVRKLTTYVE